MKQWTHLALNNTLVFWRRRPRQVWAPINLSDPPARLHSLSALVQRGLGHRIPHPCTTITNPLPHSYIIVTIGTNYFSRCHSTNETVQYKTIDIVAGTLYLHLYLIYGLDVFFFHFTVHKRLNYRLIIIRGTLPSYLSIN